MLSKVTAHQRGYRTSAVAGRWQACCRSFFRCLLWVADCWCWGCAVPAACDRVQTYAVEHSIMHYDLRQLQRQLQWERSASLLFKLHHHDDLQVWVDTHRCAQNCPRMRPARHLQHAPGC